MEVPGISAETRFDCEAMQRLSNVQHSGVIRVKIKYSKSYNNVELNRKGRRCSAPAVVCIELPGK